MSDAVLVKKWQRWQYNDVGFPNAHNGSSPTSTGTACTSATRRYESAKGLPDGGGIGNKKETETEGLSRSAPAPGPGCEPRQGSGVAEIQTERTDPGTGLGTGPETGTTGPESGTAPETGTGTDELVPNFCNSDYLATQQLGKLGKGLEGRAFLAPATTGVQTEKSRPVKKGQFLLEQQKPPVKLERQISRGSNDSGCSNCSNCSCASSNILKELRIENEGLHVRVEAVETIIDTHKKTRTELDGANKKISKLEIAIGNLQSRLRQAGYDTSVDLKDHEIFIPGHDRTFVNSLITEIGRLQKELRELKEIEDGKESNAHPEKRIKDLEDYVCRLEKQLEIKEKQNQEAENLLRAPEDVKTAKILHLEDELVRTNKELKNAEATCNVLTVETKKLEKDLQACQLQLKKSSQELVAWKEKAQHFENSYHALQKLEIPRENKLSLSDRLKIAEGQVEQLDKENTRLTEQLREVIGMNTRWQRYNDQRETYVLKLTKTSQQQQSKVTVLEKQCRDLEQTINGLNSMLQNLRDQQRKNTDAAVLSLEQQLLQREDRISELVEELADLRTYIQMTEEGKGIQQRKEDLDMIKMLEQQVQVYKDDFEQERKDRERNQGHVEILRDRLHTTTRKLNAMEARYGSTLPNYTGKTAIAASAYEQPRRLLAHGAHRTPYYLDDGIEEADIDGRDETDGVESNSEPLQCPRCAQEFTVSNHSGFMRHVGVCLDQ